jgi:RimJ/RimL family protein N-acetyltransferase
MNIQFRAFVGEYDWGWVQLHQPILRVEDTGGIMAVDLDKQETIGAVIFDNWTENSVCAHMIITKPMLLRHGFLEECFDFAFNVSGRKVMTGLVNSDNIKAQKLDEHIGFKEIARLHDGWKDGVDIIMYEMRKEDCRWLKPMAQGVANA